MSNYSFGKFVWFEIKTRTPAEAQAFYTELLPWTTADMPFPGGTYTLLKSRERQIGGIAPFDDNTPAEVPPHWLSWISVEDVDATAAAVTANGGTVLAGPMDMPDMMRMAFCADAEGAPFAIMRSTTGDPPDTDSYPGIFYWNELFATDAAKAAAFYAAVFGYEVEEMDMAKMGGTGTYRMLKTGGKMRGGIMQKPQPEIPSMWLPYVHVEDLDATAAIATSGGAQQPMGVVQMPGMGRFTTLIDPSGAAFALVQPATTD